MRSTLEKPIINSKRSGNNFLFIVLFSLLVIIGLFIFYIDKFKQQNATLIVESENNYVNEPTAMISEEVKQESLKTETAKPVEEPKPAAKPETETETPKAATEKPTTPDKTTTETAPAEKTKAENNTSGAYTYKVKVGDTMYLIADRFHVSPETIKSLNNMDGESVRIGEELKLPIKAIHTVGKGDGLFAIAIKYNVKKDLITKANNLKSDVINIDQKLIIPMP